jgi:uncharacterized protein YaeQ
MVSNACFSSSSTRAARAASPPGDSPLGADMSYSKFKNLRVALLEPNKCATLTQKFKNLRVARLEPHKCATLTQKFKNLRVARLEPNKCATLTQK